MVSQRKDKAHVSGRSHPSFALSLGGVLFATALIAAAAGLGFGCALNTYRPQLPGTTLFHSEQSFPPKQEWPISER